MPSFDDLMKVKGDEPPLKGYTNADALAWCIDSIQACIPAAEKAGVILDLENHWGLTITTEALLHIYRSVNSPWLGINLDGGNFPGDPYPEIEKIAPFGNIVHSNTCFGGGVWYTLDLDYPRIAGILRNPNFNGLRIARDARQRVRFQRPPQEPVSDASGFQTAGLRLRT